MSKRCLFILALKADESQVGNTDAGKEFHTLAVSISAFFSEFLSMKLKKKEK